LDFLVLDWPRVRRRRTREREFQDAFVARLSHFLTGLGAGFAVVVGRRYQLPVVTRSVGPKGPTG